jgi:hypothetical protein
MLLYNLFNKPQIRFSIPAEGIYPVVIRYYLEEILIGFRPPGNDIQNLMPLLASISPLQYFKAVIPRLS